MAASLTSQILLAEAAKRGWKAELLDDRFAPFIAVTGPDGKTHYLFSDVTSTSSASGFAVNQNKLATYLIAHKVGIPIAEYVMDDPGRQDEVEAFCASEFAAGHELVVKPIDCDHATGVGIGLRDMGSVCQAVAHARQFSNRVIIQRRYRGNDFRVTVVDGRFVAAAWRKQPTVAGDGTKTVAELVDAENVHRTFDKADITRPLHINLADVKRFLGQAGLDAVPAAGEEVTVLGTANLSKGGEVVDITDEVHDSYKQAIVKLAEVLELGICGADFLAEDFTRPMQPGKCILLEINCAIGLRTHHFPMQGKPRDVAGAVFDAFAKKNGYSVQERVLSK